MTMLREWLHRVWGALRRNPTDHDLERELRFHLEQAEEELRAKGHTSSEAARLARVRFGGATQAMEALRDQRGLPWLDDLRTDLKIGLRGLTRRPVFTATAALTLSIGIGATAAMFSVTNALLFRPLPVPNADALVVVAQLDEHTSDFPHALSYPEYVDYRERSDVFTGLAAHAVAEALLSIDGRAAEQIYFEYVSDNYFDVLQVHATHGRTFLPEEGRRPGDAPVVVLTHDTWQTRFDGDPAVIGRVVRLGPAELTIIGITPEAFTGTSGLVPAELFLPATEGTLVEPGWADLLNNRYPESFAITGRLRPGVAVTEAAAQLDVIASALAAEHPDASRHTELYTVAEHHARPTANASRVATPIMGVAMGLASLVLLIACANVGTLLVGRGLTRRREMALRAGLGATRRRLVRQLVTETLLLSLMGGAGAAITAVWVADLVIANAATGAGVPQLKLDPSMDWRVFGFTTMIAVAAGVLAGLAPAVRTTRIDLARAIRSGGRGSGGDAAGRRLTSGLLVMQVATSLVLLVCAGLFVQSGVNARAIDVGFRTDDLLLLSVDPLAQGYDREQARGFYREVIDDVVALPGVRSASWARRAPLSPGESSGSVFTLDGGTAQQPDAAIVAVNHVDPRFFDTIDIPVVRGRGFREGEDTGERRVAVISERAARQFWPEQEAIGRRVVNPDTGTPFEVVGVVRDAHMSQSPFDRPPFVLYPFGRRLAGSATLHVHTEGPPSAAASMVMETIRRRDAALAILDVGSMDASVRATPSLVSVRLGATIVGTLGALGLLLTAVGLYGVVSHSVAQRKQEFGIRAALGATSAGIVRLAISRGMVLTVIGLSLGFLAAVGLTPFTARFLIDVNPTDPVVFGTMALLLVSVALAACLVPSRRATKADPLAALNTD